MNNQILEKLRKLVNLATGNANLHEAEVAMQMAQKIAFQNNIDLAQVEPQSRSVEIDKAQINCGQRMSVSQNFVNVILGRFFEVRIIISGNRASGRKIFYFGKKDDVEFAVWANQYLNKLFLDLWHVHYAKNPHLNTKMRETFFFGLYKGLAEKLQEQKDSQESSLEAEVKQSYEIVLVDNAALIQQSVNQSFPSLTKSTNKRIAVRNSEVFGAGHAEGKKINLCKQIA